MPKTLLNLTDDDLRNLDQLRLFFQKRFPGEDVTHEWMISRVFAHMALVYNSMTTDEGAEPLPDNVIDIFSRKPR